MRASRVSMCAVAGRTDGSCCKAYVFDAELKPGDVVLIETGYRDEFAYAEVEVPQRAEIVSVDTLRCPRADMSDYYSGSDRILQFVLGLKDVPGEKNFEFAAHLRRMSVLRTGAPAVDFFRCLYLFQGHQFL